MYVLRAVLRKEIDHIFYFVLLVFEGRFFDHLLEWLDLQVAQIFLVKHLEAFHHFLETGRQEVCPLKHLDAVVLEVLIWDCRGILVLENDRFSLQFNLSFWWESAQISENKWEVTREKLENVILQKKVRLIWEILMLLVFKESSVRVSEKTVCFLESSLQEFYFLLWVEIVHFCQCLFYFVNF